MGLHFLREFVNINMVNKFGTFETVRTQADCDFYAEYYGKEEAQKQLGTRLRFIASDAGPGKIAYQWTSADDPSASTFVLFHEGVEQTEWFGDIKVKHGAKFNEEIDYKFPLDGAEASKMVTTKIATGKYKQFCK